MGEDAAQGDRELLDAWRRGDKAAGNALVERHFSSVYRFFRRKLDDGEAAKDLAQRTFLTCLEKEHRLRDDLRFRAFLLGIARNLLLRHLRALGKASERAQQAPDPTPTPTSPSRVAAAREEQQLLLLALRSLPLDLQMTVELHYWEELTTAEVGAVLDVAPGTVKWRLSKARERLRDAIAELAASREVRESTLGRFDHWARSLRELSDDEG